jgi:hypothetical protein
MRHARQSTIFLLSATLLLSGCATNGKSGSQGYRPSAESEPEPRKSSPKTPIPPPPAPAAYGVSHVKSVGFLRVFGSKYKAADRSCGTAPYKEGCNPAPKRGLLDRLRGKSKFKLFGCCKTDATSCDDSEQCCTTDVCVDEACGDKPGCQQECNNDCANFGLQCGEGCDNDRHPCLAERLEDPFLDEVQAQESASEQPQVPASAEMIPAVPTPQALFPSPYTGVSSGKPTDSYFPTEFGRQRSIVEPPRWQGRQAARSTAKYHSVTLETSASTESTPAPRVPLQFMIQPRQYFGR